MECEPAHGLADAIDRRVVELEPRLVETRRDLHQHPELSNREERTGRLVAARLRALGLEVTTGVAGHGVVALLAGGRPGAVVAARADMDALPIEEANEVPYRSRNPGVMHACGHDVHTTVQLGVAEVLAGLRDQLPGTVKFLFQPAEEGPPPGEAGGALEMIRQGALAGPRPAAIFGLHTNPLLPAGQVGFNPGAAMASVDGFEIRIQGRKAHGAYPQDGVDAIVVGAQVVTNLQSLASRINDPRDPLVVTVGIFEAGNRVNILAGTARLAGTIRCHSLETREQVPGWLRRLLEGITAAYGATFELDYLRGHPVVYNDPDLTRQTAATLERVVGPANLVPVKPSLGGEDFAWYQREIPGFFYFLGVRNEARGIVHGWHTPRFDVDEASLAVGVRAMANVLVDFLAREARSDE
jgi:amidohydrolase